LDGQIYRLHDVLEGQEDDVVCEREVEEFTTREIGLQQQQQQQQQQDTERSVTTATAGKSKKPGKKVTIRSFVSEHEVSNCDGGHDESAVEFRRGGGSHGKGDEESGDEEEERSLELPWEGFGDDESLGMEGDVSFNALAGWRGVH
jgi:hypothetical protein